MSPLKSLCLMLIFAASLEIVAFSLITSPAWVPHISFIILVYGSIYLGYRKGLIMGLILGFYFECFMLVGYGGWMIGYCLLGVTAGLLKKMVFMESLIAQWAVPGVFYLALQFLVFFIEPPNQDTGYFSMYIMSITNSSWLVTLLISPLIFNLVRYSLRDIAFENKY